MRGFYSFRLWSLHPLVASRDSHVWRWLVGGPCAVRADAVGVWVCVGAWGETCRCACGRE
jgi:hypothetical protein